MPLAMRKTRRSPQQPSPETLTRGTVTVRTTTFPTADDEYTPEQRRALDASLAKAEKGPYYGPFKNGAEIAAFMKKRQRSQKSAKLRNSPR
jgi:hypothetical protein